MSALTPAMMSTMSGEERSFWEKFCNMAQKEIESNKAEGKTEPFHPSMELKELFNEALVRYSGRDYCQFHQLLEKFAFVL